MSDIKIKFKKKYPEDTRWPKILLDFLDHLGEQYYPGSGLDEYDLLGIVWEARMEQLGDLVNGGNSPATNMFDDVCRRALELQAIGRVRREEYRETLEALMPKKGNSCD
ncbi:hypothetical protein OAF54_00110 [bacterium]|nr:hypothetical protein [bacterium]